MKKKCTTCKKNKDLNCFYFKHKKKSDERRKQCKSCHNAWKDRPKKPKRKCSFPGCKKPYCAKGLCNSHWAQQQRHGKLEPIRTRESLEERFWRQVDKKKKDECWLWKGSETGKFAKTTNKGYGQAYWGGKKWMAHRLSYIIHNGENSLPDHLQLDHLCRNRMCVNPNHLDAVTQRENVKRMHAYHALQKEIKRLRSLVKKLGGDPGANFFTVR